MILRKGYGLQLFVAGSETVSCQKRSLTSADSLLSGIRMPLYHITWPHHYKQKECQSCNCNLNHHISPYAIRVPFSMKQPQYDLPFLHNPVPKA